MASVIAANYGIKADRGFVARRKGQRWIAPQDATDRPR